MNKKNSVQHVRMDLKRQERCGHLEAIYAPGKRFEELLEAIHQCENRPVLVTRISEKIAQQILQTTDLFYDALASCLHSTLPLSTQGDVAIITAGSSDLAVAQETALTCLMHGVRVRQFYDVGVAGIHRTFERLDEIRSAHIAIVIAGMDGALPSVIGGLVKFPVIAVPTSVGYGSAFEGLSALLAMLNSCAAGLTVVNIDNGFGAGIAAIRMRNLLPNIE